MLNTCFLFTFIMSIINLSIKNLSGNAGNSKRKLIRKTHFYAWLRRTRVRVRVRMRVSINMRDVIVTLVLNTDISVFTLVVRVRVMILIIQSETIITCWTLFLFSGLMASVWRVSATDCEQTMVTNGNGWKHKLTALLTFWSCSRSVASPWLMCLYVTSFNEPKSQVTTKCAKWVINCYNTTGLSSY